MYWKFTLPAEEYIVHTVSLVTEVQSHEQRRAVEDSMRLTKKKVKDSMGEPRQTTRSRKDVFIAII